MQNSDARIVGAGTPKARRRQRNRLAVPGHFAQRGVSTRTIGADMSTARAEYAHALTERDRLLELKCTAGSEDVRTAINEALSICRRVIGYWRRTISQLHVYARYDARRKRWHEREAIRLSGPPTPARDELARMREQLPADLQAPPEFWAQWNALLPKARAETTAREVWKRDTGRDRTAPAESSAAPAPVRTRTSARNRSRRSPSTARASTRTAPKPTGDSSQAPSSDAPGSPGPDEPDARAATEYARSIAKLRRGVARKDIHAECRRVTNVGVERPTLELIENVVGHLLPSHNPTDPASASKVVACWAPQTVALAVQEKLEASTIFLPSGAVFRFFVDVSQPLDLHGRARCILICLRNEADKPPTPARPPKIALPSKPKRRDSTGGDA